MTYIDLLKNKIKAHYQNKAVPFSIADFCMMSVNIKEARSNLCIEDYLLIKLGFDSMIEHSYNQTMRNYNAIGYYIARTQVIAEFESVADYSKYCGPVIREFWKETPDLVALRERIPKIMRVHCLSGLFAEDVEDTLIYDNYLDEYDKFFQLIEKNIYGSRSDTDIISLEKSFDSISSIEYNVYCNIECFPYLEKKMCEINKLSH